jgi:hypothetical protein
MPPMLSRAKTAPAHGLGKIGTTLAPRRSFRTEPFTTKGPYLRAFLSSGGGIRTRDLRVMSSPEPPHLKPAAT